jgi:hypothetical protein
VIEGAVIRLEVDSPHTTPTAGSAASRAGAQLASSGPAGRGTGVWFDDLVDAAEAAGSSVASAGRTSPAVSRFSRSATYRRTAAGRGIGPRVDQGRGHRLRARPRVPRSRPRLTLNVAGRVRPQTTADAGGNITRGRRSDLGCRRRSEHYQQREVLGDVGEVVISAVID